MADTLTPEDAAHYAPGTFGCHEAMHMAHVLAELVDTRLCEHAAVQRVPEWKALANRAEEALQDLYQAIGAKHGDAAMAKGLLTGER